MNETSYKNLTSKLHILSLIMLIVASGCGLFKKVSPDGFGSQYGIKEEEYLEYLYTFTEAQRHKMLGEYTQSINLLNKCLELYPNSAASHYELAHLFVRLNDYSGAEINAKKATELAPQNKWYKMLLADIYLNLNMLSDAIKQYEAVLKLDNTDLNLRYEYANLLIMNGNPIQAIDVLNSIEMEVGITESLSMTKTDIYIRQGQNEKAMTELQKLSDAFPSEIVYKGLLAEHYSTQGQFEKAKQMYLTMLASDPDNGLVHLSLANYYRIRILNDSALIHLQKAFESQDIEYERKTAVFNSPMLLVLDAERDRQKVYNLFETLLKIHPDHVQTHAIYASTLLMDNQKTLARNHLREFIAIEKSEYDIWEQLLLLELELGSYTAMYDQASEAIEYFPNQPIFFLYQAMGAYHSSNYEQARKALENGMWLVVDDNKMLAQFYMYLGETYHKLNKYLDSDNSFEKSIELDADNFNTVNNYAYYLSLRNEKLERAAELSYKLIVANPNSPTYLDTYAWVLYKQGNYTESLNYIEKAIQQGGSGNATILEHYGDILYRLQRTDEAVAQWEKARSVGANSVEIDSKIKNRTLSD